MDEIVIRSITDIATLRSLEEVQRRIWGGPERDVVPAHQLLAAAAAGGVLLGAFTPDDQVVGFCYGFVGQRQGRTFLYSHMAGVVEEWRGKEIGFRLKQAQRREALARGFDWMVWTFDPLQGANGYFNLHRLGAEASRYHVNYYGAMEDELNRGIESDRLEVDWPLRSPRVVRLMDAERRAEPAEARSTLATVPLALAGADDPLPRPGKPMLDLTDPRVALGIPLDVPALRRADPALAQEWRAASRRVFQTYFARAYTAVDFVRTPAQGHYILRRAHAD